MPVVQMPDGRVVEFPDGMSEADINKALGEASSAEPRSPAGYVAARAARRVQDVGQGMNSAGMMSSGNFSPWTDPTAELPQPGGLIQPGPAPGPGSRMAGAAAEAGADALTNPLMAAAAPVATLTSALGGEAGAMATGDSTAGRIGGALLGGSLGQVGNEIVRAVRGTGSVKQLAGQLSDAVDPISAGKKVQSSVKDWMSGFKDKMDSVYSDLTDLMHGKSIVGSKGVAPVIEQVEQPGQLIPGAPRVDPTGQPLSAPPPVNISGVMVPAEREAALPSTPATRTEPTTSARVVSPGVPGIPEGPSLARGPQTPIPQFSQTVAEALANPGAEGFAKALDQIGSPQLKSFLKTLQQTGMTESRSGAARPQSWDAVSQLSSRLGEMISNPKNFINTSDEAVAKRLYASLQADREAVAEGMGAGQLFRDTQGKAEGLFASRERLNQFVEPGLDPEKVFQRAMASTTGKSQGGSNLIALREHVPEAADALASAHLQTTPRDWTKLSADAKVALVPNIAQRARIDSAVGRLFPDLGGKDIVNSSIRDAIAGAPIGGALGHLLGYGHEAGIGAGTLIGSTVPYGIAGLNYLGRNPRPLLGPLAATNNLLAPSGP